MFGEKGLMNLDQAWGCLTADLTREKTYKQGFLVTVPFLSRLSSPGPRPPQTPGSCSSSRERERPCVFTTRVSRPALLGAPRPRGQHRLSGWLGLAGHGLGSLPGHRPHGRSRLRPGSGLGRGAVSRQEVTFNIREVCLHFPVFT